MLLGGERDGGQREVGSPAVRLFADSMLPRRGFFLGTRRLEMTQRGTLLHKVSTPPPPTQVRCSSTAARGDHLACGGRTVT